MPSPEVARPYLERDSWFALLASAVPPQPPPPPPPPAAAAAAAAAATTTTTTTSTKNTTTAAEASAAGNCNSQHRHHHLPPKNNLSKRDALRTVKGAVSVEHEASLSVVWVIHQVVVQELAPPLGVHAQRAEIRLQAELLRELQGCVQAPAQLRQIVPGGFSSRGRRRRRSTAAVVLIGYKSGLLDGFLLLLRLARTAATSV
jgi:hypothetical protein